MCKSPARMTAANLGVFRLLKKLAFFLIICSTLLVVVEPKQATKMRQNYQADINYNATQKKFDLLKQVKYVKDKALFAVSVLAMILCLFCIAYKRRQEPMVDRQDYTRVGNNTRTSPNQSSSFLTYFLTYTSVAMCVIALIVVVSTARWSPGNLFRKSCSIESSHSCTIHVRGSMACWFSLAIIFFHKACRADADKETPGASNQRGEEASGQCALLSSLFFRCSTWFWLFGPLVYSLLGLWESWGRIGDASMTVVHAQRTQTGFMLIQTHQMQQVASSTESCYVFDDMVATRNFSNEYFGTQALVAFLLGAILFSLADLFEIDNPNCLAKRFTRLDAVWYFKEPVICTEPLGKMKKILADGIIDSDMIRKVDECLKELGGVEDHDLKVEEDCNLREVTKKIWPAALNGCGQILWMLVGYVETRPCIDFSSGQLPLLVNLAHISSEGPPFSEFLSRLYLYLMACTTLALAALFACRYRRHNQSSSQPKEEKRGSFVPGGGPREKSGPQFSTLEAYLIIGIVVAAIVLSVVFGTVSIFKFQTSPGKVFPSMANIIRQNFLWFGCSFDVTCRYIAQRVGVMPTPSDSMKRLVVAEKEEAAKDVVVMMTESAQINPEVAEKLPHDWLPKMQKFRKGNLGVGGPETAGAPTGAGNVLGYRWTALGSVDYAPKPDWVPGRVFSMTSLTEEQREAFEASGMLQQAVNMGHIEQNPHLFR